MKFNEYFIKFSLLKNIPSVGLVPSSKNPREVFIMASHGEEAAKLLRGTLAEDEKIEIISIKNLF